MTLRFLALVLSPFVGGWQSPSSGSSAAADDAVELGAPAADEQPAAPDAADEATEAEDAGGEATESETSTDTEADADAEQPAIEVVDTILPCGLRVITAKDASLPVAAVVLAIEIGTRDDPDKLPGLVHALAYQLQQGNRELAPGEAIATAHDAGGLAAMAVGPAQVRFESLVPISALDAQLRVEALRLRAPNHGRELWLKSLSYARADAGVKDLVPREAAAIAWQDPAMAHDGRAVPRALGDMLDQAVGAQLSRLYDYRAATLVVVGPDEPQALLERVEPLFAKLPARPRKQLPAAAPPPAAGAAPRVAKLPRQKGDSMVWAVPGNPSDRAWAQVLCGTLNRQRVGDGEPPKARLRCTFADDPRRPLMLLRAIGFDPAVGPEPLIAGRLARIAALANDPTLEPELAELVATQRERIEADLLFDLRTPLDLASYLASASEHKAAGSVRLRDEILGLPLLPEPELVPEPAVAPPEPAPVSERGKPGDKRSAEPPIEPAEPLPPPVNVAASLVAAIPELLDTRHAVLLIDPEQDPPPPFHQQPPPGAVAPQPQPQPQPQPPAKPQPATPQPAKPQPTPEAK